MQGSKHKEAQLHVCSQLLLPSTAATIFSYHEQWWIQVLRLGGGGGCTYLGFQIAPPPLSIFPEAIIKIYTWIF